MLLLLLKKIIAWDFSGGAGVRSLSANAREAKRHWFNPWVRKTPERRKQSAPAFLPGESHGQRRAWCATGHGVARTQTGPSRGAPKAGQRRTLFPTGSEVVELPATHLLSAHGHSLQTACVSV